MSPKIAPYILSSPTSLHVLVDTALPVSTERSGGADTARSLADDLVIQRRARLVALVVHRAVRTDAEACRLLGRVDVRAEEQEFPAVSLFLPFDHSPAPGRLDNQSCRAPPLCDTVVSGKYFIAEADQLTASILTAHADVSVTQAKSE